MSNEGRIYYEKLDENTSAANGPYYITNDLTYCESSESSAASASSPPSGAPEVPPAAAAADTKKDPCGSSLYYSHTLKLLFYTYSNGKSFVAVLEDLGGTAPLTKAVLICPKPKGGNTKVTNLGLSQYTEVVGHAGLIFAIGKGKVLSIWGDWV